MCCVCKSCDLGILQVYDKVAPVVKSAAETAAPYVKSAAETAAPFVKSAAQKVGQVAGPAFRQAEPTLKVRPCSCPCPSNTFVAAVDTITASRCKGRSSAHSFAHWSAI